MTSLCRLFISSSSSGQLYGFIRKIEMQVPQSNLGVFCFSAQEATGYPINTSVHSGCSKIFRFYSRIGKLPDSFF